MKMSKEHLKLNVFKLNHNVFPPLTSSFSVFSFPLGDQANFHSLWSLQSHVLPFITFSCLHCSCFQTLSHIWFFVTSWTVASQAPPSSTISWSLLKFMSIESVMLSNHLIFCHPFLLLPLPSNYFPNLTAFHSAATVLFLVAVTCITAMASYLKILLPLSDPTIYSPHNPKITSQTVLSHSDWNPKSLQQPRRPGTTWPLRYPRSSLWLFSS